MPYPTEIALVACTVGGASALESGTQLVLSAEITSSRGLMWGATGWQYPSITRTVTGTEGAELSFSLPATDLAGWRLLDDSGSTIDVSTPGSYTHTYTIRLTTLLSGRPVGQRIIGPFVLPAGSGPVDLDTMLPAATIAGGVVLVPDTWDAKVTAAEAAAVSVANSVVSVRGLGAVGDGVTDDTAALAAITAADIIFPAGTYRVASNLTLAGAVRFQRGATLKPDAGATVTFTQGTPEAGWYQIFDTTAGGLVTFGNTQIGEVRATWFGAKGDGATDDTAAIAAAVASMSARGTLMLAKGTHNVTGTVAELTPGKSLRIVGFGRTATTLYIVGNLTAPVIYSNGTSAVARAQKLSIESLTIRTENRGFTGDAIVAKFTDYMLMRDVDLLRIDGHAIKLTEVWDSVFDNVSIASCGSVASTKEAVLVTQDAAAPSTSSSNHQHWNNVQVEDSQYIATRLGPNSLKNRFVSCKWHGAQPTPVAYDSLVLDGASANIFEACTFHHAYNDLVTITDAAGTTPAGNRFVGCSFNAAGVGGAGYGIKQVAGDRTMVEACDFGVNGLNDLGSILVQGGTLVLGDTVESWDITKFTTSGAGSIVRKADPVVWLTPEVFASQTGSPALSNAPGGFTTRAWLLDAATTEGLASSCNIPAWVAKWDLDIYWSNASTGTGNVALRLSYAEKSAGDTLGSLTAANVTAAAGAQDVVVVSRMATGVALSDMLSILVARIGGDAADTLANDIALLGVRLTPNLT